MSKVYLYIRGQGKRAQLDRLLKEYPRGETVEDKHPPEELERIITEAGPGDLIAADNIAAIPEITAETYKNVCSRGAGLYFLQQPYLSSEIFSVYFAAEAAQETALHILQRQINAETARQRRQRDREKAGLDAAAAAGRKGGRRAGEKQTSKKEQPMKDVMRELIAQGIDGPEMFERLNSTLPGMSISRNTFYKYRKQLKNQETEENAAQN